MLWIDEIEKGLGGAGASCDGGTSARLVGHFLFWLQEGRARVFVAATANDIGKLPPELFRRGRFDELFFVDLPNAEERLEIITLYARRYMHQKLSEGMLTKLVNLSDGFAGADIDASVAEVAKEAILKGETAVNEDYWSRFLQISFLYLKPTQKLSKRSRIGAENVLFQRPGKRLLWKVGNPKLEEVFWFKNVA